MGTVVNSYTYDNVGNRDSATENGVTTTYSYDRNDRLVSSTQNGIITTYAYDDNGNTLSKAANGDDTTFTYDARNKLTAAVQHQGGSPVSNVYFEYDIDGNRTQKTDNGNITNFVVDRNQSYAQVVHETNDQNATQVTYTHGDDLISQDRSASINYYNYDGLGSTRSLTDSAGLITDTVDYNAYGSILHQTGTTTNSYLYTGEQFEPSQGTYYLRNRYYDPETGRFPQMDTWMGRMNEPATLNKFIYTHGDPINGIDPSGQFNVIELSKAIGISALLIIATDISIKFSMHSDSTRYGVTTINDYDELGGDKLEHLLFSKKARESNKERSTDVPSYAKGYQKDPKEDCHEFAISVLTQEFGADHPKVYQRGPGSDYSKIKKHCERGGK